MASKQTIHPECQNKHPNYRRTNKRIARRIYGRSSRREQSAPHPLSDRLAIFRRSRFQLSSFCFCPVTADRFMLRSCARVVRRRLSLLLYSEIRFSFTRCFSPSRSVSTGHSFILPAFICCYRCARECFHYSIKVAKTSSATCIRQRAIVRAVKRPPLQNFAITVLCGIVAEIDFIQFGSS